MVTPDPDALTALLRAPGVDITDTAGALDIRGTTAEHIGRTAAAHGIPLYELTPSEASLEDAFMTLTHDAVEYTGPQGAAA